MYEYSDFNTSFMAFLNDYETTNLGDILLKDHFRLQNLIFFRSVNF